MDTDEREYLIAGFCFLFCGFSFLSVFIRVYLWLIKIFPVSLTLQASPR